MHLPAGAGHHNVGLFGAERDARGRAAWSPASGPAKSGMLSVTTG
jgi:hypothetical protein